MKHIWHSNMQFWLILRKFSKSFQRIVDHFETFSSPLRTGNFNFSITPTAWGCRLCIFEIGAFSIRTRSDNVTGWITGKGNFPSRAVIRLFLRQNFCVRIFPVSPENHHNNGNQNHGYYYSRNPSYFRRDPKIHRARVFENFIKNLRCHLGRANRVSRGTGNFGVVKIGPRTADRNKIVSCRNNLKRWILWLFSVIKIKEILFIQKHSLEFYFYFNRLIENQIKL